VNAEQAVIGAVILSNGRVLEEINLTPEDFLNPVAEKIFRTLLDFHRRGKRIDMITIGEALPKHIEDIHAAFDSTPSAGAGPHYAAIVAEQALRRRLEASAATILGTAKDTNKPLVADDLRKSLDDAFGKVIPNVSFMASEIGSTIEGIGKSTYLPSPWQKLNDIIGGFRPGALYLVAARPGVGKTVVGLQVALHLAKSGSVAFASLEMSKQELHKRIIAQTLNVHLADLTSDNPLPTLVANQIEKNRELLDLPLAIDDRSGVSVHDIRTFARSVHRRKPLSAIVVDYVGLISDAGKERSRYETVTFISQQLKVLARDLNVPVIALAQLNREVESRADKKPTLSDLRDSGSLEQDADVVVLLRRDNIASPKEIDLFVAKNRHGESSIITLNFFGEYSKIT
jgi:replicative DNA helicase